MSEIVVGIDLGTTYSAIAVYRNGKAEIIPNDRGSYTMPSWVSFGETERLIGESAKDRSFMNPANTVFGVKRYLGRSYDDRELQENLLSYPYDIIDVDNKPIIEVTYKKEITQFAPEEISAIVLEKLKSLAEIYLECPVTKAVITVPAHFNDAQRQATKNAGRIAGLEVLRIINEPTAASLAYGIHNKFKEMTESHNILIYDFGGGTFDVSIVTIENGVFEVKATKGEAYLGGDDIDINLTKYFVDEFKQKYKIELQKNKKAIRRLRNQCEKLKKNLTLSKIATIEVDYIYSDGNQSYDLVSSMDRTTFNKLNAKLFDTSLECVEKTLDDAKMKKEDINEILLIGGSSRIPRVREIMQGYFNKSLNASLNPDEAVAIGAAIQAAIMSNEEENTNLNLLLHDVNPLSLGIEIRGGEMNVIIPRNTQIPTCRKKRYETSEHGITEIPLIVYEGESTLVKRNRKLGEFLIKIPKLSRGEIKFDVFFEINVDGILNVSAMLIDGDLKQDLQIDTKRANLSEEEIQRMINEAVKHREADEKIKEIGKAKYELKEQLTDFEDALKTRELSDEDLVFFRQISDETLNWMTGRDITVEDCEDKVKRINEELVPLLLKYNLNM